MLSGGLGLAFQIVATVILARLLSPQDFGVVTMVTTLSILLLNCGLNGFTEAIIQREEIDHYLISNIFWLNVGGGLLLSVGFAAAGSFMAQLYREPLVAPVSIGISTTIFISSLSVCHLALLKRAMRFTATSTNEFVSRALSLIVSIILAWEGWKYWALVVGLIVLSLAQSVVAWWMGRWTPSPPRRAFCTPSCVRLAIAVYGRFTVNYFTRNIDNLLVGWKFGAVSLGFYKKAYDLFALSAGQVTAPLTNVAVSALSRYSPRSVQYRQHLLGALSILAFIGMGLSALLTLLGDTIIPLLPDPPSPPPLRTLHLFPP